MKYYAALDKNNIIIAVGVILPGKRFDFRCFPFTCQCMGRWEKGGGKYCQLFIDKLSSLPSVGKTLTCLNIHVDDFKHGKIKRSQRARKELYEKM